MNLQFTLKMNTIIDILVISQIYFIKKFVEINKFYYSGEI